MWPGAEGMGMKNNPSWTQTNEPQTTVTTDAAPASCAAAPADDDDDDGKWKGNGMKDGRVWGPPLSRHPFGLAAIWPPFVIAVFGVITKCFSRQIAEGDLSGFGGGIGLPHLLGFVIASRRCRF